MTPSVEGPLEKAPRDDRPSNQEPQHDSGTLFPARRYYACCPPEKQQREAKVRSDLYVYVRWLLLKKLPGSGAHGTIPKRQRVETVIRELRKLPWDQENDCHRLVAKMFLKLARTKADAVPLAADIRAALAPSPGRAPDVGLGPALLSAGEPQPQP